MKSIFFTVVFFGIFTSSALAQDVFSLPITSPSMQPVGESAHLIWIDNSSNEVEFVIERKKDNLEWIRIARVHWNDTTYEDKVYENGNYCYRVKAANFAGDSEYSNEACRDFAIPPPAVPLAPILAVTSTPQGPILTWTPQTGAFGIHIDRGRVGASSGPYADFDAQAGIFHDHKASAAFSWCYKARFYNTVGDSAYSNVVCSQTNN